MKKSLRFIYGKKKNGQFYWHLKSANGEIVAQGEGYKRRAGVLKVAKLLANYDGRVEEVSVAKKK